MKRKSDAKNGEVGTSKSRRGNEDEVGEGVYEEEEDELESVYATGPAGEMSRDSDGDDEFAEEDDTTAEVAGDVDFSLLEALEASEKDSSRRIVEKLDAKEVRKLVLGFEKKLKLNLELRIKYFDQPEKFMDSEVELDEEVHKLQVIASAPEQYPDFVALNAVPSLLSLLNHENSDISNDVLTLLQEMTDSDAVGESEEAAKVLVDSLVQNSAIEIIVQSLFRLQQQGDEERIKLQQKAKEEEERESKGGGGGSAALFSSSSALEEIKTAVQCCLGVIENMLEVRPELADLAFEKSRISKWLLARVREREFDGVKLYSSEMLALMLQNSVANQKRLVQANGLDVLLQSVAAYKIRDPALEEEVEMLENLFDALCSVVLNSDNKERFVRAEGVELMVIILKQKRWAYPCAMKVLDFALTGCASACERFVDVLGLKTLFAAFMGKVSLKRKIKSEVTALEDEMDDRTISIAASLFINLPISSARRDRLLSKFVESEFEKIDRLMELYDRYAAKVRKEEQRQSAIEREEDDDDEELQEKYLMRLEAGLFTLQLIALTLAFLWHTKHSLMRERIRVLLRQRKLQRQGVQKILKEYIDNLGEEGGLEEKERRRSLFLTLMEGFGED